MDQEPTGLRYQQGPALPCPPSPLPSFLSIVPGWHGPRLEWFLKALTRVTMRPSNSLLGTQEN